MAIDDTPYGSMIREFCVEMGFCGGLRGGKPTHIDDYIPSEGEVTVAQFLVWLFQAEGDGYTDDYDPTTDRHYEALKNIFVKHMGSDCVDASALRWEG